MSETTMPTAEAEAMLSADDERASYELAFHVLPTVVEGEVSVVTEALKKMVADAGGEIIDEEAPQRFDLAYEIVKYVEGKYRKFGSAYFGWVRFKADASAVGSLNHAVETRAEILRHLLIRLTREEEVHPFRFHEALVSEKKVRTVDESETVADTKEKDGPEEDSTDENVEEPKLEETSKEDEA